MKLKDHIAALNKDTFLPINITDLDCFLEKYEGKTLFEHLSRKPNYLELMNGSLLAFAQLLDKMNPNKLGRTYEIFVDNLKFMCDLMGKRETTERLNQIVQDPSSFFYLLKRSNKSVTLRVVDSFGMAPAMPSVIRRAAKEGKISLMVEKCKSWEEVKQLKEKFQALSDDPLFTTHRSYMGWGVQGLVGGLQYATSLVSSSAAQHFPDFSPENSRLFKAYVGILDTIDKTNLGEVSEDEIRARVQLLLTLYRHANNGLQPKITATVEGLLENPSPYLLNYFLTTILNDSGSLSIAATLSPEVNLNLLKGMKKLYSRSENQSLLNGIIDTLQAIKMPQEFSFGMKRSESQDLELDLARLLAIGNFPLVSRVALPLNSYEGSNQRKMPILLGCEKTLFESSFSQSEGMGTPIENYLQFALLAHDRPLCFLNATSLSLHDVVASTARRMGRHVGPSDIKSLIRLADAQGVQKINLLSNPVEEKTALLDEVQYMKEFLTLPQTLTVYHQIPLKNDLLVDFLIDSKGVRPGPCCEQSEKMMALFNSLSLKGESSWSKAVTNMALTLGNFSGAPVPAPAPAELTIIEDRQGEEKLGM